jgi:hypothetical protein
MKPYIKIALFAVFFFAVGGILFALYLYNLKAKDLKNVKPDFVITAVNLQKAFEENEKAATGKYVNKILEVSGEIATVKSGEKKTLNVSLKTASDFSSVICTFPFADSTRFAAERSVSIRGVCSGFLMDVLLNNCALIENKK